MTALMPDTPDVVQALVRIGAIQFGQFETEPGVFAPLAIRLSLLPSYPAILRALSAEIAPLVRIGDLTHLLPTPSAVPLGVAVSLAAEMPLVYPSTTGGHAVEGAYDFNVPTVLLTDLLTDGAAERSLITRVRPLGLDVKAVVAVLDLGREPDRVGALPLIVWRRVANIVSEMATLTPSMRAVVLDWLR
jgi:orotate phosphoribosyltransferase